MRVTRALAAAGLAAAIATTTAPAAMGAQDVQVDLDEATSQLQRHAIPGNAVQAPPSSGRFSDSKDATQETEEAMTYRIHGATRIETAIAASQDRWPDAGAEFAAKAVVLSRSDAYADALGGSALAGAAEAPLLLTRTGGLHADVEAEIARLLGTETPAGPVYVLGGETAIAPAVTDRLTELGHTVVRLDGATRYETSVSIARQTAALTPTGLPQIVFATTGLNFPDGLAAGATAGGYWGAVVLTRGSSLPGNVSAYLSEMAAADVPIVAIGGPSYEADFPWDGWAVGQDRFETAQFVAELFWGDPSRTEDDPWAIGLSTGMNWPDALAGGAHIAVYGPLLLSKTDSLPGPTTTAVSTLVSSAVPSTVQYGIVYGGPLVVTDGVLISFDQLLNP